MQNNPADAKVLIGSMLRLWQTPGTGSRVDTRHTHKFCLEVYKHNQHHTE